VVPLPEVFAHYLQGGRVDVGFLGAAQVDRFGNLNSTVIGPYVARHAPAGRGRRAGDRRARAPDLRDGEGVQRSFVERTRLPHHARLRSRPARVPQHRACGGPRAVITDFGILTPHPSTDELQLQRAVRRRHVERRAPRSAGRCAGRTVDARRRRPRTNSTPARAARRAPGRPMRNPSVLPSQHA
jgi:glutaconate CoA-transferase subunit B